MNDIDNLFTTLTDLQDNKKLPPVHLWQPEHVGSIDIRIDSEGQWYHEGTRIERQPLVDLFATILRFDEGAYYLVTPAEKMRIEVEDVPFMAIDLDARGLGKDAELLFSTNVGDYVIASSEHPLTMRDERPYIDVRDGLQARLTRSVYYRLVDFALESAAEKDREEGALHVHSQGTRFYLGQLS